MIELLDQLRGAVFATPLIGADGNKAAKILAAYSLQAILFGHALWIGAYLLSIARSHRDGFIAVPAIAICLNITWETIILTDCLALGTLEGFSYCRGTLGGESMLAVATILALDIVLLIQGLVIVGRRRGMPASILIFGIGLVAAFAFHSIFMTATDDWGGVIDSWIINLVMSLLFVVAAVTRPAAAGLSFVAGWLKLLGSLAVAVGLWIYPDGSDLDVGRLEIVVWLALAVLLLDIVYIVLLAKRQPSQDLTA